MDQAQPQKRRWFSWGSLGRKRKQRRTMKDGGEACVDLVDEVTPVKRKLGNANLVDEWLAAMNGQERKKLRRLVRPNDYDQQGLTPLHRACGMGNVSAVKFLLALGASPNIQTDPRCGLTPPILFAASNGHSEVVKLLVDSGADVNDTDSWGNTALYKASCYNYIECVKVLLQSGANPDLGNRWGALPLQYSVLQGLSNVVRLLLEYGAQTDLFGEKNEPPPLIGAAMRGHQKCVVELLKYDPNLEITFLEKHHTALYVTLNRCLSQHSYWELTNVTSHDRFQCIYLLLSSGAEVSLHCLDLLYCENFIPYDVSDEYILLIKLLLRAYPYTAKAKDSFRQLFEHVMSLVPHKWTLLQLICSVGFTPCQTQLSELNYTLMDSQFEALSELVHNPRPLMDQCRWKIRASLRGNNVLCATEKLPLPDVLKDFIAVKNASCYIL